MLKRMLIPAMLQEIRSGNGDDDGPTTLRFCKGCAAATVTTDGPTVVRLCKRLLDCANAVATPSLICAAALAIQENTAVALLRTKR